MIAAVVLAFLLGLGIGLACNHRRIAHLHEAIRWAGYQLDRYAKAFDQEYDKRRRWQRLAHHLHDRIAS